MAVVAAFGDGANVYDQGRTTAGAAIFADDHLHSGMLVSVGAKLKPGCDCIAVSAMMQNLCNLLEKSLSQQMCKC